MTKLEITPEQERLARFAKAMGHPTRIAILNFLAQRNECLFRRHTRGSADCESHSLPASERTERCRPDTRYNRTPES